MKDRVKQIRKVFKETQQTFGDKLNVSKSTIEAVEYGRREATSRMIADICRIYNVNEEWLREGTGEMLKPMDRETELAMMVNSLLDEVKPSIKLPLIKAICQMTEEEEKIFTNFVKEMAKAIDEKNLP